MEYKKTLPIFLIAISVLPAKAFAYNYLSEYSSNNARYTNHSSEYRKGWTGRNSNYIRNFSNSHSYFGVPQGSSVSGLVRSSHKHESQYIHKVKMRQREKNRLNNLPPPCGVYGRAPSTCPVERRSASQ